MGAGQVPKLSLVEQALVAARAGQVRRQAVADELAPWEAAPHIDAVLSQTHSVPALRATCSLLRYRLAVLSCLALYSDALLESTSSPPMACLTACLAQCLSPLATWVG